MTTLYTVGHSNRTLQEFIELLQGAEIQTLVDVRATPQSQRFPHFSEPSLREALGKVGITYHWAGRQLGGRRPETSDSRHRALPEGLRGYADYMETEPFQLAAGQMINLSGKATTAIMCAEKEPLNCHRSLISDYLLLQGVEIIHLIDSATQRSHQLRMEARRESAELVYDNMAQEELFS
jgi:uncharacterized protein (DUF488 family)